MKSKKFLLLLPLLVAPIMTGCGGNSGKTKITFWHTMGANLKGVLDRMITEFRKENPDIVIEHESQGGYDDLYDKLTSAIPAGKTPVMAYCYPDHVADYNNSNIVIDVTSYINDPELGFTEEEGPISDFIKAYWDEGTQYLKDGIYSVPYAKSTEIMYYNKKVFDQNNWTVPSSWEELEDLMADIKAKMPDVTPLGYDSDANMFITFCEQYGIPYTSLDKANNKGSADFNNDAAKNMMRKLKEWYDKGYLATQGTSSGSYTSTLFTEGQLLMTVGSTGGASYNYTESLDIGIAELPSPSTDAAKRYDFFKGTSVTPLAGANNNHIIMQGPSICFFKRASEEQKVAAWKFYKFIVKTMNTAAWSVESGYSPVRTSTFQSDAFKAYLTSKQEGAKALIQRTVAKYEDLSTRYFVSPAFKGSSTARNQADGIMANVFKDTKTIDKAFADAYAKTNFAING